MTIPAGLVIAGCEVFTRFQFLYVGTAGTKTARTRIGAGGSSIHALVSASGDLIARAAPSFTVLTAAGPHEALAAGSNIHGNGDDAGSTITADFTAARTIEFCNTLSSAADSSTLQMAEWEIVYP
jgi:hypothetical protein